MLIPYASAQACTHKARSLNIDLQREESSDAIFAKDVGGEESLGCGVDVSQTSTDAKVGELPRTKVPDFNQDIITEQA